MTHNLLFLDARVEDREVLRLSAKKQVICVHLDWEHDTWETLNTKVQQHNVTSLESIGIVSHGYFQPTLKLFKKQVTPSMIFDIEKNDPELSSWGEFQTFFGNLVKKHNVKRIDFISCNLSNSCDYNYIFNTLEKHMNIMVCASSLPVGSPNHGGVWHLNRGNIDLKDDYFDDSITKYKYVLGYGTKDNTNVNYDGKTESDLKAGLPTTLEQKSTTIFKFDKNSIDQATLDTYKGIDLDTDVKKRNRRRGVIRSLLSQFKETLRGKIKEIDPEIVHTKFSHKSMRLLNCSKDDSEFDTTDLDLSMNIKDLKSDEGFYCLMQNEKDEVTLDTESDKKITIIKELLGKYTIKKIDKLGNIEEILTDKTSDFEDVFDGVKYTLGSVEGKRAPYGNKTTEEMEAKMTTTLHDKDANTKILRKQDLSANDLDELKGVDVSDNVVLQKKRRKGVIKALLKKIKKLFVVKLRK